MIQTSTNATNAANGTQNDCCDSLGEDDETLYRSLKDDLNRIIKQPRAETIEAILKFSKNF